MQGRQIVYTNHRIPFNITDPLPPRNVNINTMLYLYVVPICIEFDCLTLTLIDYLLFVIAPSRHIYI